MAVVKPSPRRVDGLWRRVEAGNKVNWRFSLPASLVCFLAFVAQLSIFLSLSLSLFFSFFFPGGEGIWKSSVLLASREWMYFPLLGNSVENEERERNKVEECKALHANQMTNARWIWNDDDNRKILWILDFVKGCWLLRIYYHIKMKEINEYLFQDSKYYIVINALIFHLSILRLK